MGPAVIGDDGPCWMVCTGGHCASTGGISGVVVLDLARVGLWSERLQDRGLTGSGALGPAVIGDDGPRWMVCIGGRCASKGGISGNGPGLRRGVHPCDYEMGSNGTRLALGMLRGDWPARARSGPTPGMSAMPEGRAWEMGLKAAAHEQRMAGWCIGMPCEHSVCGCESVTCGVRVAAPTPAWCANWGRDRSSVQVAS